MKTRFLIIMAALSFVSCQTYQPTTMPDPTPAKKYTQQDLSRCYALKKGMTVDKVLSIMGAPIEREFIMDIEEWHYCSTATGGDFYAALYLYKDTLVAVQKYVATAVDEHNMTGTCENFLKRGTYRRPLELLELIKTKK